MKKILIAACMLVYVQITAQTGTYEFRLDYTDKEDSASIGIKLYQSPGKMTGIAAAEGIEHRMVVDTTQKKMLELIAEEDEEGFFKEAFLSAWEEDFLEETVGMSIVFDLLSDGEAIPGSYSLLPEKRVLNGINCQKVELLEDGVKIGSGWVATGMHIRLMHGFGFMNLKEGTLVQFTMQSGGTTFSCNFLKASKTVENPAIIFSFAIPEGYEVIDSNEEELDIEEGE
jgi:hypothetical protein